MALSWQKQSALLKDQSSLGDQEVSLRFRFAFCKCKAASHRVQGSSRCCIRQFPFEVERTWLFFLTLQYYIGFAIYQNESATGTHVFPILNPPPSSLLILSLWVVPVYQPQASSIVHRTWTGNSFHIWYYTCFNVILPNHPTFSLPHRVQKTVLYISVSFAVSYTGF